MHLSVHRPVVIHQVSTSCVSLFEFSREELFKWHFKWHFKWPFIPQWIGLRENLQESPMIFMGKSMVSCRFSLKPIHWILHHTTHSQIPFLPAQSCFEPCPAVILSHVCWAYNSIFKTTTITPSLVYNICVQSVYILYIYVWDYMSRVAVATTVGWLQ